MHTGLSASLVDLSDLIQNACDDFRLSPALYLILAFTYPESIFKRRTPSVYCFFLNGFHDTSGNKACSALSPPQPPFLLSRIESKLFTSSPKQAYYAIQEQLTATPTN